MLDSDWSDLGPELLTEILVLLPFRDRLVCEKTCKSWHCTLSCATQPNVWGYTWTLVNARSGRQQQLLNLNHDHFMAHIPEPSHKHNFVSWALCRIKSVSHIYLGHPNNPVDLLTDSSAIFVVCELLTQLKEQDQEQDTPQNRRLKQPELSVSVAGMQVLSGDLYPIALLIRSNPINSTALQGLRLQLGSMWLPLSLICCPACALPSP